MEDSSERRIRLPNFRGGPLALLTNHDHECIIAGVADSSKTWAACVKSFLLCTDPSRPEVHGAVVRKVFHSLESSVMRTFRAITAGIPMKRVGGATYTDRFVFNNGSELVAVGMDKNDKLLSSEWDFIQVCQAEQLTESDWEVAAHRCTGRGAKVAYPQIFGDCNPAGTNHWIRARAKSSRLTLLNATHKDNPALYDDAGNVTPEGQKRLRLLESTLSGVRRQRLWLGQWATAEGAVYDMFSTLVHVTERKRSEMTRWFLGIDNGYTNPAVILLVGEDSDGRRHIFREFYQRGVIEDTVCEQATEWVKKFNCEVAAVDDAEAGLVAKLNRTINAKSAGKGRVQDGIALVQTALVVAGDGRPRLTVDPSCVNTINEFESYQWQPAKDVPKKENDHAMDACRYLFKYLATPTGTFGEMELAGTRLATADLPVDDPLMLD